ATLQSRVARKFGVGKARISEEELVGADGVGCEKIVGAGCADDVVLIDTVATHADRADELAIAIKREAAGKNRDAVGKIRIGRRHGEHLLQSVVAAGWIAIIAGRMIALRQKANCT